MRIGHLTDLHLVHHLEGEPDEIYRDSRRVSALLSRALSALEEQGLDLLMVTGDLTHYPVDDVAAEATVDAGLRDLRLIKGLLDGAGFPTLTIPGNHDDASLWRQVFGDAEDLALGGFTILRFVDYEGEGHVPHRRGTEWERFVRVCQDDGKQIHLQHFVVWPPRNEDYPHTYAEGTQMMEMLARAPGVRLTLSGHYHPGVDPFVLGNTLFSVAPAFCAHPYRYRIYTLEDDDITWEEKAVEE